MGFKLINQLSYLGLIIINYIVSILAQG